MLAIMEILPILRVCENLGLGDMYLRQFDARQTGDSVNDISILFSSV